MFSQAWTVDRLIFLGSEHVRAQLRQRPELQLAGAARRDVQQQLAPVQPALVKGAAPRLPEVHVVVAPVGADHLIGRIWGWIQAP